MTVRELIEILQDMPQDYPVWFDATEGIVSDPDDSNLLVVHAAQEVTFDMEDGSEQNVVLLVPDYIDLNLN